MVRRYDRGDTEKATRRDNGWLLVPATLTRTGVFTYRAPDGTTRRELRTPEEVFHPDSLASFQLIPVTNNHPPAGALTSENTAEYSVGTTGQDVRRDGETVKATLAITSAGGIKAVDAGRRQVSNGYTCDLDPTPGEYQGQKYDAIQRNIRGNHVALVDTARAGPVARLHMDSGDAAEVGSFLAGGETPAPEIPTGEHMSKLNIDGVDFELPETAHQAVSKALDAAKSAATTATARADALVSELTKVKADAAKLPESIRAEVKARLSLEAQAQTVLGSEFKADGKSDRDVHVAALLKLRPEFKADGQSDAYVQARFDVEREMYSAGKETLRAVRPTGTPAEIPAGEPAARRDLRADMSPAQRKMIEENAALWKQAPTIGTSK